ncbi:MAG: hypothetical protein Q7T86_15765 [Hyphomicrobiaceae bacterium]|nr:hypothetical protein [Hyphomicrobiaceae bacterium]
MNKLLIGLSVFGMALASTAIAADKKTGQDFAPGQNKPAGTSAKELAPGQKAKHGQKDANDYAPGQKAQDANEKTGTTSNGSSTGNSGSR